MQIKTIIHGWAQITNCWNSTIWNIPYKKKPHEDILIPILVQLSSAAGVCNPAFRRFNLALYVSINYVDRYIHCQNNLKAELQTPIVSLAANWYNTAPLNEGDKIHADKGYHSEANKELLKSQQLEDRIMHKRKRNEPEDDAIKQRNKTIAQHRYVIERTFGSLKRSYGWSRSRYIGLEKTTCYLYIRCLAYNIKRAMKLLSLNPI